VARLLLDDGRVATVIWPLERFLEAMKFAFVPLVIIGLSFSAISSLGVSSNPSLGEVALKLVVPALAIVCAVLLQTSGAGSWANRAVARVHRQIALRCNHDDSAEHSAGNLACRLTPDVFQAPVFDYRQQSRVVKVLAEACNAEESGQYWFVQGSSGTGKTRTGLRLVQRLVRDPNLFELGTRCYLYDFSDSLSVQRKLRAHLKSDRHDDAVVLIDNFQLVKPKLLRTLTNRLVGEEGRGGERLMVFLAREAGAWDLSPGRDVRLLSEAKAARRYYKLEGPSSIDVVKEIAEIDGEAAQLIAELSPPGLASAAQLHLAQVVARNRSLPAEARDVICLLLGQGDAVKLENVRMLALLTAVAMHRGVFSRRSLWRAIRVAVRSADEGRPMEVLRMASTFRRFHRIGLVPKIRAGGTRYLFHEDIARQCIDTLADDPRFADTFEAVGTARLKRLEATPENALRAWLVGAELGDQKALVSQFEAALRQGAYQRMEQCLSRARQRYDFDESTMSQLAILLDRTGEFAKSRKLFAHGLNGGADPSARLAALFATSRLEANHQHEYQADLQVLVTSSDPLVSIVGDYWKIHIEAHRGVFEPDRLKHLTAMAYEHLDGGEAYWQLHSISRMYFDSLRHLYLTGEDAASAFTWQQDPSLSKYMGQMPTYDASSILYARAHLVGHTFIPRLGIFGQKISSNDAAIARLEADEVSTVDDLITTAQRLYRRARDEFWLYGDREERYLQAETLNAMMIEADADLENLDQPLDEYEQFIVDGEQSMLASYPSLYRFRRDMLGYFRSLLDPQAVDSISAKHRLREAEKRLQRIAGLDAEIGNVYGQVRVELLGLLLGELKGLEPGEMVLELDGAKLDAMAKRIEPYRYGFEKKLLRHLAGRGSVSMPELRDVFRFYPFVNQ
jgi:hypothetical protein